MMITIINIMVMNQQWLSLSRKYWIYNSHLGMENSREMNEFFEKTVYY